MQEPSKNGLISKKTIFSFMLVAIILFFLISKLDVTQTKEYLLQIHPEYFILAIVCFYLSFLPRILRWNILLNNLKENKKLKDTAEIYLLSWFINALVPAKLGDLYRSHLYKKNYQTSKSTIIGTIFIERLFDLSFVIITVLILVFILYKQFQSQYLNYLVLASLAFISALTLLMIIKNFRNKLKRFLPEKFKHILDNFQEGASQCLTKKSVFNLTIYTILTWFLEIFSLYFVLLSLSVTIPFSLVIFTLIVSALLSTLPITPSGAGAVELAVAGVLILIGIESSLAITIAILHRLVDYWSLLITGSILYLISKKK